MIRVTWVEIGLATAPGRYDSRYGVIEVTPDDLWIWQKYPNAAFVVILPSPFSDETVSRLGIFELRENWNVPGHEKGDGPSNAGNEVTMIEQREYSAEPPNDLQKRIEALIKGSD
jgi:hypothetical protein